MLWNLRWAQGRGLCFVTSVPLPFHSAGSSGDLPDLHGFQSPSTLSLLLDTVVGWRSGARRLARDYGDRCGQIKLLVQRER